MTAELQSSFKCLSNSQKGRQIFYKIVKGSILKKYSLLNEANKSFISYKRLKGNASKDVTPFNKKCKKRGRYITDKIKEHVIKFLEGDVKSRMCPGKKDFVSRGNIKKQKRILCSPFKMLYEKFTKDIDYNISYASFCRRKPRNLM